MKMLRSLIMNDEGFLLVALLILLMVFGCDKGPPRSEVIRIGAVLPLSGDIAEYGKRCKAGIDLAVEELNMSGSIDGRAWSVIYEDSRGVPRDGVSAFQKLVSIDKVSIVVGPVGSSVALAIEPIATENRVILFSPAASSPKLTGISKYFFRDWPSDVLEASVLAEFVRSRLKLKEVAILYVNNEYGLGLKSEFVRRFTELGGAVSIVESYEQGATDFRAQLAKIKSKKPEALYLAGYHREMATATKQIRELGIDVQILGDADYGVQELLEIAGNAAEGAIYSIPEYDPTRGPTSMRAFVDSFRKKYGSDPTIFEANAYDAVKILDKAIRNAGMNTERMSEYIATIKNYDGASGTISFGQSREVVKPVSIKKVEDGKFILFEKP